MKRIYNTLLTATTLLACFACSDVAPSDHTPETPPVEGTAQPLRIAVENTSVGTRSILIGDRFTHESQVAVWLLTPSGENASGDYDKSMDYQYKRPSESQGVWIAMPQAGETPLMVTANTADVLAHYPARLPSGTTLSADHRTLTVGLKTQKSFGSLADYNGDNSFTHKLRGSSDIEVLMSPGEVDYMTGSGSQVGSTAKSTTIRMKHNLSMVILRIYKDPQNSNPGIVKSFTLSNAAGKSMLAGGSFDVATSGFTPNGTTVSYEATMSDFPEGMHFALMVYPTPAFAKEDVTLTLKADNSTYTLPLEAGEWKAGHMTLYEVKLNPTSAELSSGIRLKEWPDGDTHELPVE